MRAGVERGGCVSFLCSREILGDCMSSLVFLKIYIDLRGFT